MKYIKPSRVLRMRREVQLLQEQQKEIVTEHTSFIYILLLIILAKIQDKFISIWSAV